MSILQSNQIHLASRPQGRATADNFQLSQVELEGPTEGQVAVRNLFVSVDPYMRGRMNEAKSYVPPFQIGQAMEGGALGEVIESRFDGLTAGDVVLSNYGWRDTFVCGGKEMRKVDKQVKPLSAYLGVLGMPGMTAWVGLKIAQAKSGEVVFISGAAGAVGSVAGQIARQRGCRVIGSAGSAEKVKLLTEELGFDAAFNYKEGLAKLETLAPDGIDVYFDNVGGEHLEAALNSLRPHGRIAACGAISRYNDSRAAAGPGNLALMIGKRLTMTGFIVSDWSEHTGQFIQEVGGYLASGKLKLKETVVEGIANAPKAFLDLLAGGNVGKMVVKI
jgi:NADPH-dependent curcumin reductase CurA